MSEIRVSKDTVEMTVTYRQKFSNDAEMIEAFKGAAELRGMMPAEEEELVKCQDVQLDEVG